LLVTSGQLQDITCFGFHVDIFCPLHKKDYLVIAEAFPGKMVKTELNFVVCVTSTIIITGDSLYRKDHTTGFLFYSSRLSWLNIYCILHPRNDF
jgi:hypothetical protein